MPWCNATGNTHGLWNILAQKLTLNLIKLLDLTSWNGKKHGGHRNRSKYQVNMSSQTKDTGNFTNYLVSSKNNSVQSLSCVWLFAAPWTAAYQASLSTTNSWRPPKPMSIVSVMPSNHLIHCRPLLLPPLNLSQHQGAKSAILPSMGLQRINVIERLNNNYLLLFSEWDWFLKEFVVIVF